MVISKCWIIINLDVLSYSYTITRFNLEAEGADAAEIDFSTLQTDVNVELGLETSYTYTAMLESTVSSWNPVPYATVFIHLYYAVWED